MAEQAAAQKWLPPLAWDNIDGDEMLDEYANMIGVSPRVVRATVQVAQIRADRAKQAQGMQAMAALQAAENA